MGLSYRLQQFWRLLKAEPFPEEEWPRIQAVLTAQELALFRRQAAVDQAHGLRVLQTLQQAEETDAHLLTAALLHDVGKARLAPNLWDRVVGAVGEKLLPARAEAWGQGRPTLLRRPFVIRCQHAAWGAEMAQQVGSAPLAVWLIAHHQDAVDSVADECRRRLLQRLKWADDQN